MGIYTWQAPLLYCVYMLVLKIPFAQKDTAKAAAKASGGRLLWDPDDKSWSYDGPSLPKALEPYVQNAQESRTHILDVPFNLRSEAQTAGAQWTPQTKAWTYRGPRLPEDLSAYKSAPYSYERLVEDELNGKSLVPAPSNDPLIPRPHQDVAIKTIQNVKSKDRLGFLLADDVGLGKTISAYGALRDMDDMESILIVCPLAVVEHWRTTVMRMGDKGKRIVIINFDRLQKLFTLEDAPSKPSKRTPSKRTKNKRLAAKGGLRAFDAIIVDEAHKTKNPTALRSKYMARLIGEAYFTLWLSATAGQNPLELSYLAPLLAQVTGDSAKNLADFQKWCIDQDLGVTRGAFGKWEWRGDPKDCDIIYEMLFGGKLPAGIRRRPENIAGWPEINRILFPVHLSTENRALYDKAWNEFRAAMRLSRGKKDSKIGLVAQLRFRQKASLLRVPGTLEQIEDLLDNGHQVAISVAFSETLRAIKEPLEKSGHKVSIIDGTLTGPQKERERLAFQRGETKICIFTVEEAISLHQGEYNDVVRSLLVHDPRYSAIQTAQIEGRCHRDGRKANVYHMYASDTVEQDIVSTVIGRLKTMKRMIGDDVQTLEAVEALLDRAA